jgi:hypothetical protein
MTPLRGYRLLAAPFVFTVACGAAPKNASHQAHHAGHPTAHSHAKPPPPDPYGEAESDGEFIKSSKLAPSTPEHAREKPNEKPAAKKSSMPEDQQPAFMLGCVAQAPASTKGETEAYCRCGMQVAGEVVPAAEWTAGLSPTTRGQLATRTIQECRKHLSDASIEAAFMHGCVGKDATKNKYCGCSAKAIKDKVGVEGLMGTEPSPDAIQAIAPCSKLMPESMVRPNFVAACSKHADAPSCECLWTELRKNHKVAELADEETEKTPKFRGALVKALPVCKKKRAKDPGTGF